MVGLIEGQEGFGVFGGRVDFACVFDADNGVGRGVHDEEVAFEVGDALCLIVSVEVGEKALADLELSSRQGNLGLTVGADFRKVVFEKMGDMAGVERSAHGDDVGDFWNMACRSEHGRATEGVAEKNAGCLEIFAEMRGSGGEVLYV